MPQEISQQTAQTIENELIARHGLIVIEKAGIAASVIGTAFDVARLIQPRLPSGQAFNKQFATTIPLLPFAGLPGGVMLVPAGDSLAPRDRLFRTAHEAKHVDQFRNPAPGYSAWDWGPLYVAATEFRATQEAGGYLVNIALEWATTGEVLPVEAITHVVTNNYAITPQDQELVRGLVEIDSYSIGQGVVRDNVSRLVIRRLFELQPGALMSDAAKVAEGIVIT